MADIKQMTLGSLVDFCIDYNKRNEPADKEDNKPKRRKATQADINAFFG